MTTTYYRTRESAHKIASQLNTEEYTEPVEDRFRYEVRQASLGFFIIAKDYSGRILGTL